MKCFEDEVYRDCIICRQKIKGSDAKQHAKNHREKENARTKSDIEYKKFLKKFDTVSKLKSVRHKDIEKAISDFGKKVMLDIKILNIKDTSHKNINLYNQERVRRVSLDLSITINKDSNILEKLKVDTSPIIGSNKEFVNTIISNMETFVKLPEKGKHNIDYITFVFRELLRKFMDTSYNFRVYTVQDAEEPTYGISDLDFLENFSNKNKILAKKEDDLRSIVSNINVKKDFFTNKYKSSIKERMMLSEISDIAFLKLDDKRKDIQTKKRIIEEEEKQIASDLLEMRKKFLEEAVLYADEEYNTEVSDFNQEMKKAKLLAEELGADFRIEKDIEISVKQMKSGLIGGRGV
jgi:hypothetical protein